MRRSQKSKRITWASDVNLCQVKLFLSEESPSQVGIGTQDNLQAKVLRPGQSDSYGHDDNLPPGFEGIQPANLHRVNVSQIPLTKWRCPSRLEIDSEWLVVGGDDSKEMEAENQREMRVLEAIYPRPSAIPQNPAVSADVEKSIADDQNTPLVPVTPIEEEDTALGTSVGSLMANPIPMISQPQHFSHGILSCQGSSNLEHHASGSSATVLEPEFVAAAQAVLTSVISKSSSSDQNIPIDSNLLIQILSNPKMVEQLVTSHCSSSIAQNGPTSSIQNMPLSRSQSLSVIGVPACTSSGTHMSPYSMHNMPSSTQSTPAIGVQIITPSSTQNMPFTSPQYIPNVRSPPKNTFDPTKNAIHRINPVSTHPTRPETGAPSLTTTGPFHPPQIRAGSSPNLWPSVPDVIPASSRSAGAPTMKDTDYFKRLVQQHGEERRDILPQFAHQSNQPLMVTSQEPLNFTKSRESKPKIMKPCMYFNSPKGCRNGANCSYQHDTSSQQRANGYPDVQNAKRVKFDREITGT